MCNPSEPIPIKDEELAPYTIIVNGEERTIYPHIYYGTFDADTGILTRCNKYTWMLKQKGGAE